MLDKNRSKPACNLIIYTILFIVASFSNTACQKLVDIPTPQSSTSSPSVFSDKNLAVAAVLGIYSNMINNNGTKITDGAPTIFSGMSSDELVAFDQSSDYAQFQNNSLISTNGEIYNYFWSPSYSLIYQSNSVIEGLSQYSGVDDSTKSELIGEAKFIRGLIYFYLTNLFGDIPLVTTTNWNKTNLISKTIKSMVYDQIVQDLLDAQKRLPADYSVAGGERTRANKYTAAALLSRVYLYLKDWKDAEIQSSYVINDSALFSLSTDLSDVFSANSSETILQLQQNPNSLNGTQEGYALIPSPPYPPYAYLSTKLLNAFEPGDLRRKIWIDSAAYDTVTYYYPFKYIIGYPQVQINAPIPQYYMVLRLAEQYLIRSEARAQQNNTSGAADDLNKIRARAKLPNSTASSRSDLLQAIAHERQTELFCEWGHRWLDLIRTNQASVVLSPIKPAWNNNDTLYPIPQLELSVDPNLTQNPGYTN